MLPFRQAGMQLSRVSTLARTLSPFQAAHWRRWAGSSTQISAGNTTPISDEALAQKPKSPFYFDTGYALFAKRPSRPFPPPFLSPPSASFSDPLSTHDRSRDRRPQVNGEMIRGITNGDDAVLVEKNFIGANDGVGAWATRPRGHAAYVWHSGNSDSELGANHSRLWSRLILHFWAFEAERDSIAMTTESEPDPVQYLHRAYEQTLKATTSPNEWHGTTTACGALLHHTSDRSSPKPLLFVTNLGDSQVLVIRPKDQEIIYKTSEQWHWFDCPRQLGTNSPDTPNANAVMDKVVLQEDDVVLAMSDGVVDNLWEHEVLQNILDSIKAWEQDAGGQSTGDRKGGGGGGMQYVAQELVNAARIIAEDPFAESPFMERAVEEGLAMEGGI